MPDAARIRRARSADDEALASLDLAVFSPLVTPAAPPREGQPFFERLAPEEALVAEVAGRVVGYVCARPATRLVSNRHVYEIQGLAVHPDHRRRGLGGRLVRALIEDLRGRGVRKLRLRVLADNDPALELYESLGFRVEGRLREEFQLGRGYVDDLLLALALPPPDHQPSSSSSSSSSSST